MSDAEATDLAGQCGLTPRRQEPWWFVLARGPLAPILARGGTWEEAFANLDAGAGPAVPALPVSGARQGFLPGLFGG